MRDLNVSITSGRLFSIVTTNLLGDASPGKIYIQLDRGRDELAMLPVGKEVSGNDASLLVSFIVGTSGSCKVV